MLPISLSNIAIGFNLPIKKLPYPHKGINREVVNTRVYNINPKDFNSEIEYNLFVKEFKNKSIDEYVQHYCLNDVRLTKQFVEIIWQICLNENVSLIKNKVYSAPGLSLKIFLKNYNKFNLNLAYNIVVDNYVRSAYYGGRCEVHGNPTGKGYLFHFDFSGMYGWCLKQKFPFGKHTFKTVNLDITIPGYYYIEYTSNMQIPILPHHNPINNKLMFVNGHNEGVFWFEEILLFKEQGGIIHKVKSGLVFEKYEECFNEFVDHFNKIRNKGGAYKSFAKLMINSLYGKLGNKRYEYETAIMTYEEYLTLLKSETRIKGLSNINNVFIVTYKTKKKNHQKFGIQFAAAITSKARVRLYKNLLEIQKMGGRLLYCDTDSYFVEYFNNVIGETHGEVFWDPQKKDTILKDAVFVAPKVYAIKYDNYSTIVKIKGIENKKISFEQIKESFYSSKETLEFDNENYLKKKNLNISFHNQTKILSLQTYDKRIFIHNKLYTIPYKLENGLYS